MKATGRSFVDHWKWAAKKGLMNSNTAGSIRAACKQVLSVNEDWENMDLTNLDVEDVLKRFQNLHHNKFKPASLESYKSRFRGAFESYRDYLSDPGAWKPSQVSRTPRTSRTTGEPKPGFTENGGGGSASSSGPLVEYPFPLRDGLTARLVLPRDLKQAEVARLGAFMRTVAIDFEVK